jgi:hypothetical protein
VNGRRSETYSTEDGRDGRMPLKITYIINGQVRVNSQVTEIEICVMLEMIVRRFSARTGMTTYMK